MQRAAPEAAAENPVDDRNAERNRRAVFSRESDCRFDRAEFAAQAIEEGCRPSGAG